MSWYNKSMNNNSNNIEERVSELEEKVEELDRKKTSFGEVAILVFILYFFMMIWTCLYFVPKADAATTLPVDRTQVRPAPVSLVTVPPKGCEDQCIRWANYGLTDKPGKLKPVVICKTKRGKKIVRKNKHGVVVLQNIYRKCEVIK